MVNDYASEHVQLAVHNLEAVAAKIRHARHRFVGSMDLIRAINFAIGAPATLPTTGYAKRASGVTAHTFLNLIAFAKLTEAGFWDIAEAIEDLAANEGFPAHRGSVTRRREITTGPVRGRRRAQPAPARGSV